MRSDFSLNNKLRLEKPETLRVRSVVDAMFGCMVAIRGGYRMARDWDYIPNSLLSSALLLSFSGVCFVLLFLYFCRFYALVVLVFMLSLELGIIDVYPIFSCPTDHVLLPDWQPRIVFCLFGDVAFSEYFFRFFFVWRVCRTFFSSGWCFFYLVTTGWIFYISLCENSVNQSIQSYYWV